MDNRSEVVIAHMNRCTIRLARSGIAWQRSDKASSLPCLWPTIAEAGSCYTCLSMRGQDDCRLEGLAMASFETVLHGYLLPLLLFCNSAGHIYALWAVRETASLMAKRGGSVVSSFRWH